jgi:hypothetical protein
MGGRFGHHLAAGRIASPLVVAKLVELGYLLGYLKRAKRHNARAVNNAVFRLRQRLHHDGIISAGNLSGIFSQPELKCSPGQKLRGANLNVDTSAGVVLLPKPTHTRKVT